VQVYAGPILGKEGAVLDRAVRRAGAGAAMAGAVLGIIFNLLHPRGGVSDAASELNLVAGSPIWLFDHFMLMWALLISLVGLIVIGLSFVQEPAASWGRVAATAAAASGALALTLISVDGMASGSAAEAWSAAQSPETLAAGTAVATIAVALFTGLMFTFFGLTPVLFGGAVLSSGEYPRWLGYLAVASGALGLITGSIQYLNGISDLTATLLFPIASLAFTVFALLMGWTLWKRTEEAPVPTTEEAIA
jgi:hypothetical protein